MTPRRFRVAVLLALGLALLLVACGPAGGQQASGPLKIGLSVPLSGASADPGEQISRGAQLAANQVNNAGGINGRKVELDIQDDQSNPTTGVALIDRFAQGGVVAAVGFYNSPVALAAMKPAADRQIPIMVQGISAQINDPWAYHSVATDDQQAIGATQFLKARGSSRFALMTDTSAFGTNALQQLNQALQTAGLTPVASETFEVNASDLTPQLLRIKNANADAIILFSIGGQAVDDLYYQDMVDPDKPAVKTLRQQWKEAFPDRGEMGVFAIVGWDQTMILVEGFKSGANSGADMKKFLDSYSSTERASGAPGSTWRYTADDRGGLKAEDLVWMVYKAGVLQKADL